MEIRETNLYDILKKIDRTLKNNKINILAESGIVAKLQAPSAFRRGYEDIGAIKIEEYENRISVVGCSSDHIDTLRDVANSLGETYKDPSNKGFLLSYGKKRI